MKTTSVRANKASGRKIREARTARGWTQADLAERARITKRGLQYIETGERQPYPVTLHAIAHALELPEWSLCDKNGAELW